MRQARGKHNKRFWMHHAFASRNMQVLFIQSATTLLHMHISVQANLAVWYLLTYILCTYDCFCLLNSLCRTL